MKKNKILAIALVALLSFQAVEAKSYLDNQLKDTKNNVKYNRNNYYFDYYKEEAPAQKIDIKDPKLIKISSFNPISENDYKKKINKDNAEYQKIKATIKSQDDFAYHIYRIFERILRANNLDYTQWKVAIVQTNQDINAYATINNVIVIYSTAYDMYKSNDDALAFLLAHEISHRILGHNVRLAEINKTLNSRVTKRSSNTENGYDELANAILSVHEVALMKEARQMEFMADAEAVTLITKAGYSQQKAKELLNTFAVDSTKTYNMDTHPSAEKRVEAYEQTLIVADPNWKNIGRENIYKSDVLPLSIGLDRNSFIIEKSKKQKEFYTPESVEQKVMRFAYRNYVSGNMSDAIKYLKQCAKQNESNPIPLLYISYANEYLYKQTNDEKYLKRAQKAIDAAKKIDSSYKYVVEQEKSLTGNNL